MIGLGAIKSAAAPYIAVAVVLALLAGAGYVHHKGVVSGKHTQLIADQVTIGKKDDALRQSSSRLRDAGLALSAASRALRAVAEEAKHRIEQAKSDEAAAQSAKQVAVAEAERLRARLRLAEGRVGTARGHSAACRSLLDFDVDAELAKLGCPLP